MKDSIENEDSNNKQHKVLCNSKAHAYINLDHDILIIIYLPLKTLGLNAKLKFIPSL